MDWPLRRLLRQFILLQNKLLYRFEAANTWTKRTRPVNSRDQPRLLMTTLHATYFRMESKSWERARWKRFKSTWHRGPKTLSPDTAKWVINQVGCLATKKCYLRTLHLRGSLQDSRQDPPTWPPGCQMEAAEAGSANHQQTDWRIHAWHTRRIQQARRPLANGRKLLR